MIFFIILCFGFYAESAYKGKKTGVTFDKALPEDISNENFPDRVNSFDFPNANLLDLVKTIGKLTGINFIVDPSLSSKRISIIAPSPITVAEAYKAFLSALSANGYTVVKSGAFWKIESTEKAHKDNIEVYSGDYFPNTDQLITRIIKLKHINAVDFEKSVKWLLSQDNKISTLESSNSIILSDYGSVIERIMKIVYELDIPGSGENIKLIQVEHASAEELAGILSDLLSIGNKSSRRSSFISKNRRSPRVTLSPSVKKKGALAGKIQISNIIPDMRTNSLVVSANKQGFERVKELVKKLDAPVDPSRTGGVYVYNILYGTAEEVYNTLMGIKPSSAGKSKSQGGPFPPMRHRGSSFSSKSSQSPLFGNVNIMADSNTNSLIVSAKNKYEYERVLSVLKKIDVPRDQVFIQAIISEMIVDKGDNREFNLAGAMGSLLKGVGELSFDLDGDGKKKLLNQTYPFFDEKSVLGSVVAGFLSQPIGLEGLQKANFGPGLILGLPFMKFLKAIGTSQNNNSLFTDSQIMDFLGGTSNEDKERRKDYMEKVSSNAFSNSQALNTAFIPLLKLLKTSTNVNVLSIPQLTTLDNVTAFIEVGENAPLGVSTTNAAGTFQSTPKREDVTIKLDITPRINPESGTVRMDIKQKFDDFSERSSLYGVHVLKRNIETKMVLHDGETAVLGGLLTDKETKNEKKVPILGDLPLLGWLFKGSDIKKEKRNLLVFITPTIIRGKDQKRKTKEILSKKLEERIQFIEKHMKGKDPHIGDLDQLIPGAKEISDRVFEMEEVEDEELLEMEEAPEDSFNTAIDSDNLLDVESSEGRTEEPTVEEIEEDVEAISADVREEIEGTEPEELTPSDYQPALPSEDSSNETSEEFEGAQEDFIPIEPEILE
ncbi:MAG: hypothetical protein OXJ52_00730 [Oligoflexia bacterium]|nr:hypothetical protein [Oligoflexia bacterium]